MDYGDDTTCMEPGRRIVGRLAEPTSTEVISFEIDSPLSEFVRRNEMATERLVTSVSSERMLELERAGDGCARQTFHPEFGRARLH